MIPLRTNLCLALALTLTACGSREAADPPVSEPDEMVLDTAGARTLRDSAQATLAKLLSRPETVRYDSVIVVQPPREDGRTPAMAVCGRIGGSPGINGATRPLRFIYQSRWTVFVEEEGNLDKFNELWNGSCAAPGAVVVVPAPGE